MGRRVRLRRLAHRAWRPGARRRGPCRAVPDRGRCGPRDRLRRSVQWRQCAVARDRGHARHHHLRRVTDVQAALRPADRHMSRRPDGARPGVPDRSLRRPGASRRPVTDAVLADVPATAARPAPLSGFTVGITAARRSEELTALLERRGADVVSAPAIRIVPLPDDDELLSATTACVESAPDVTVVTTGIGFRGWMEAADGWGLGDALRMRLAAGRLLARGPKARGAIRSSGLREAWSPQSESMSELLGHLLRSDV